MREFDSNGLRLAEFQGKLFENSCEKFDCSTSVFIRRFYYSNLLKELDKNDSSVISLDVNQGLESIKSQFGESKYGKIKKNKDSLFWVGYFYRYISYTRKISTRLLMKIFEYPKMFEVYYSYHTQDPEWCIRSLLEIYNYPEEIFDPNYRWREAMKKSK